MISYFHIETIDEHTSLYRDWYHYGECIRDFRLTRKIHNATLSASRNLSVLIVVGCLAIVRQSSIC